MLSHTTTLLLAVAVVFGAALPVGPHVSTTKNDVEEHYFVQHVDHFGSSGTFQQRVWRNDAYYKKDGPIFLNIGTNDAESPAPISAEPWPLVVWGKKLNARLFNMEMRYFGKSHPTLETSPGSLKYLNASQSVEDIHEFIGAMNKELKLNNPKWFLFGSGYGGAIVLWNRQKYPGDTAGGVGSSPANKAQFDFHEMPEIVEKELRAYNPKCAINTKLAFDKVFNLLETVDGRAKLDDALKLDPPLSSMDLTPQHVQNFVHVLIGHWLLPVQFSRVNKAPYATGASLPDICDIMMKDGFPEARLTELVIYVQNQILGGFKKLNIDYDKVILLLRVPLYISPGTTKRLQTWQNCNEIGQVPATTNWGIFGKKLSVDYFVGICRDIFADFFTRDYIEAQMKNTNAVFGDIDQYNGTNVIIPNHSVDPYRLVSTTKSNNPTAITVMVNGTGYGADQLPIDDHADPADLKKLRTLIFSKLTEWSK